MIIYSWNVNGIRAAMKKGFWKWFQSAAGDVICLQETKAEPDQISEEEREREGYASYWNPARVKKGYSGTVCYSRIQPLSVEYGFPGDRFQGEGRMVRLEFEDFFLFNIYFPNGQMSEERLEFKLGYYDAFLEYAQKLRQQNPLVICGDFNTAHTEIDLKNPRSNQDRSGFLPVERAWLDRFIQHGYVDTFREFNKEPGQYTWWSYRFNARANNAGWRIDYFFVSDELKDNVQRSWIEAHVPGSDHCPIGLEINAS